MVMVQDPRHAVARYQAAPVDLILLDLNMPELDGYALMAEFRALNDPLLPPILVLTAQSGRDHLLRALQAGARDFVAKPFDRAELLMRVRNLIEAQLTHRELHDRRDGLIRHAGPGYLFETIGRAVVAGRGDQRGRRSACPES